MVYEPLLQGLTHVVWYLDDILLTGETEKEHLQNLEEVLVRLKKFGLREQMPVFARLSGIRHLPT